MRITPNFHFGGDCLKAIELYKKAFDIEVISLLKYKDANPIDFKSDEDKKDYIYHAELLLGGNRVIMFDDLSMVGHLTGNSISLVITFDTGDEVINAYEVLKDNAVIINPIQSTTYSSCMVSLIDKYGMRWELMTEKVIEL